MPVVFEGTPPFDLWPTKEPTARAVDGNVEVTLTVDTGASPPAELKIRVVLELEDAQSLRAQLKSAVTMARVQLKGD